MRTVSAVATVAAVLLLTGCVAVTPEPTSTPVASPTPTATPTPSPTPTSTAPEFEAMDPSLFFLNDVDYVHFGSWATEDVNFVSPSRNVGCGILGDDEYQPYLWGCAIGEKEWDFPRDSPDDYCFDAQVPCGGGIEASGTDLPHPRYRGDPGFPGAMVVGMPDVPVRVLEYGQSVTFNDVTCYSEEIGITCEHAVSGHGFVIAKDRNDIY